MATAKFVTCAVRTERWRFVNNSELYNIHADPGETTDVSTANPEVVAQLRNKYDAWWDKTVPLMVNEGLTTERVRKKLPLVERYKQETKSKTLPTWKPSIR